MILVRRQVRQGLDIQQLVKLRQSVEAMRILTDHQELMHKETVALQVQMEQEMTL